MTINTAVFNIKALMLLALIMVISFSNYTYAEKSEQPSSAVKSEFHQPHIIIETYIEAVIRGELIIIDRKLDKSMITPIRVDYRYDLKNPIPIVQVYSELVQPIPVPALENSFIHAVSSLIDADGHISETRAHIWVRPQDKGIGI